MAECLSFDELRQAYKNKQEIRLTRNYFMHGVSVYSREPGLITYIVERASLGLEHVRYYVETTIKKTNFKNHRYLKIYMTKEGLGAESKVPIFEIAGDPLDNQNRKTCFWHKDVKTKTMYIKAVNQEFNYCPKCGR